MDVRQKCTGMMISSEPLLFPPVSYIIVDAVIQRDWGLRIFNKDTELVLLCISYQGYVSK